MGGDAIFGDGHFDNAADDFVRLLHLIAPVTSEILGNLPPLGPGAAVLDLACGTGEPGLTLARSMPLVQVVGIDSSRNMIDSATTVADGEQLANIRFQVSAIDEIALADRLFDAAISRFGALQFGDTEATARHLARILKPHAAFSIAVWDTAKHNTFFWLAAEAFRRSVDDVAAMVSHLDRLATAGRRERWLHDAGLRDVNSEFFSWGYRFDSVDAAWAMVTGKAMFGALIERIDAEELRDVRKEFVSALEPMRGTGSDGHIVVPQTCRLIWGTK